MKWKKLGKLFDPTAHKLNNNCHFYAQSPQALVFADFIRIYFSTRERDETEKYLSHIAYIEITKDFSKIIDLSKKTVLELGSPGCFDEHGIFPLNVFRDESQILGYIGGWSRRKSVSVETAIGLARSHDNGLTFCRIGDGPIVTSSLHEPFLVGDPFVAKFNNHFHMWYIYGTEWLSNSKSDVMERIYKIGHAKSFDGIRWVKTSFQLINNKLNSYECQALPTVIYYKKMYHMWFCYREAFGFRTDKSNAYRIGYAYSTDLETWCREDESGGIELSLVGWDSEMICYPHVFHNDGNIFMLYNGNEFGKYGFGLAILED